MPSAKRPLSGVTEPIGDVRVEVSERMGTGRGGCVAVGELAPLPVGSGVEKPLCLRVR